MTVRWPTTTQFPLIGLRKTGVNEQIEAVLLHRLTDEIHLLYRTLSKQNYRCYCYCCGVARIYIKTDNGMKDIVID
jgi:hypothetical protein